MERKNNTSIEDESQIYQDSFEGKLGVEEEDLGIPKITNPYDPEKIKVDQQNVNLGSLIEMLEEDEIDLMPDFQRSMDLWNDVKKSQLIESLLLGLPLPSFYFSVDEKTNKWLVVDGLQRLCTFRDFIVDKKLDLTGLEFLGDYEGMKYDELSREEKRKISGSKINIYVIEKQTPSSVKFLIFKRVNTGGLVLTPQEMRHALNQGVPSSFIQKLAEVEEFTKATDYRIKTKRMEDRDFANRFVAFYTFGYKEGYEGELDRFLNDAMKHLFTTSDLERDGILRAFKRAMILSFDIFGNDAFRKRYDLNDSRKPISKSVFDTISFNFAILGGSKQTKLRSLKKEFRENMIKLFNDYEFNRAITTGTGQKSNVRTRFEMVNNLIKQILKNDQKS